MMSETKIDDGGSAFPHEDYSHAESMRELPSAGLSMRDYFAAKAMQGFCANPAVFAENSRTGWGLVNGDEEALAKYCYFFADAMIAARSAA
jgi:hypothetical protein